jgi:hypothetical protein
MQRQKKRRARMKGERGTIRKCQNNSCETKIAITIDNFYQLYCTHCENIKKMYRSEYFKRLQIKKIKKQEVIGPVPRGFILI